MSSPSSMDMNMDIDVEPSRTSISPPMQQPPPDSPTRPCDTQNQSIFSPARLTTATVPSSGFGSLTLAFRPIQAIPSASLAPHNSNIVETKSSDFLSLPEELKARTLSFVPAREVASTCRAVCPQLREFIDRHEHHIAHLKILRDDADLQHRIDVLNQMSAADLVSYVSAFRCWVAQRGLADYICKSWYKPFHDWISRNSKRDKDWRLDGPRWMEHTRSLMYLQLEVSLFHAGADAQNHQAYSRILSKATQKVKPGDRDHSQYVQLCKLIAEQRDSPWLFDYASPEVERRGKLQTYPTCDLTEVTYNKWQGSHVVDPFCPTSSVAQIPLPRLPDTRFCYYVEEEWCIKLLNTGGVFSPMAKAALLEAVKIS